MTDFIVMWSATQIASRDGVSKQAVSKTIGKLLDEKSSTPVERDARGRIERISLAHYDEYRQRFINPAKATAPIRTVVDPPPISGGTRSPVDPSDTFEEARRQSEWLKVGREKIRHQEESGQLVRRDVIDASLSRVGAELQSIIRRLPNRADDLAMAVSKEGVHGVRVLLRQLAFEIGNQMADKLAEIAVSAPEHDELIEDEER